MKTGKNGGTDKNRTREVHIGLVGKYVKLHDAYLSVVEALNHAGYAQNAYIRIHWIDSENINERNVALRFPGNTRDHRSRRFWKQRN